MQFIIGAFQIRNPIGMQLFRLIDQDRTSRSAATRSAAHKHRYAYIREFGRVDGEAARATVGVGDRVGCGFIRTQGGEPLNTR